MTALLSLEDFLVDAEAAGPILPSFGETATELIAEPDQEYGGISAAYDLGYQTGWAARDLELAQVQSDLTQSAHETLQAFTFTLEEARTQVLEAIGPVFRALVAQILPALADKMWGQIVLDELEALAGQATDAPVVLSLSPEALERVHALIKPDGATPIRLVADPELKPLQASFRIGTDETLLDFDRLLSRIADLAEAAMAHSLKEIAHG